MSNGLLKATLASLVVAAAAAFAGDAAAQQPTPAPSGPPRNWVGVFGLWYTGIGRFDSPVGTEPDTTTQSWNVGSGVGLGVSFSRLLGQAALIGVEAGLAPSVGVEITRPIVPPGGPTTETTTGNAKLGQVMATGRLMTGGGGGLGFYLHGGVGALMWSMPAPAESETDLALRYGAGFEYQFHPRRGAFLEWGQFMDFHKHRGVTSNTVRFSQIRGGVRIGW